MTALGGMPSGGLTTDQAPPLSIPISFFLIAPLVIIAAGLFLMDQNMAFLSRYMPAAMGITHLATLGFLGTIMLGAFYQMIPVVAGVAVPGIRLAHGVQVGLVLGFSLLVRAFATGDSNSFRMATAILVCGFLAFIIPTSLALKRAPARSDTVTGLRLSVLGLVITVSIGTLLALGRSGVAIPGVWATWFHAHISAGLLGWIGCLIVAVSWQVIPMFYLTSPLPAWSRKLTLVAAGLGTGGAVGAALLSLSPLWAALVFGPLAVLVWLVHPILVGRALWTRRRKRADGSIRFWWMGIVVAPLLLPLAVMVLTGTHPRWSLLFGWIALWGWAGLIVHGMLTRIVAFLIWFHRFAPWVGKVPVPPMRRIYPDRMIRIELALHVGTLIIGALAILTGHAGLAVATGAGLVATGGALFVSLLRALSHRTPVQTTSDPT